MTHLTAVVHCVILGCSQKFSQFYKEQEMTTVKTRKFVNANVESASHGIVILLGTIVNDEQALVKNFTQREQSDLLSLHDTLSARIVDSGYDTSLERD